MGHEVRLVDESHDAGCGCTSGSYWRGPQRGQGCDPVSYSIIAMLQQVAVTLHGQVVKGLVCRAR
jgi:hypothetical protein